MGQRTDLIKKKLYFRIAWVSLFIIILAGAFGYGMRKDFFPPAPKAGEMQLEEKYTLNLISVEDTYYVEEDGNYITSFLTPDKEAFVAVIFEEERIRELELASEENPIKVKVVAAAELSEEEIGYMYEYFGDRAKYVHEYMVIEAEDEGVVPYLIIAFVLIVIFAFAFSIYVSISFKKEVFAFFEENPIYNSKDYAADKVFSKEVEVVKDYLFILTAMPAVIKLSTSHDFKLKKVKRKFRTVNYELFYLDENGEECSAIIPKLKKDKLEEFKGFLNISE